MTPDQAADLAARTLTAIDDAADYEAVDVSGWTADRERVASDLAGLRAVYALTFKPGQADTVVALRDLFAENLRRTAALYGVTE